MNSGMEQPQDRFVLVSNEEILSNVDYERKNACLIEPASRQGSIARERSLIDATPSAPIAQIKSNKQVMKGQKTHHLGSKTQNQCHCQHFPYGLLEKLLSDEYLFTPENVRFFKRGPKISAGPPRKSASGGADRVVNI
jgi:hypothetical protein